MASLGASRLRAALARPRDCPCLRAHQTASGQAPRKAPPAPPLSARLVAAAPAALRPYLLLARADRPVGTWLCLLPAWWALALAAPAGGVPDAQLALLLGCGAFLARGAGCTVNDMWDQRFDRQVARTRARPIAAGDVSPAQASGFLALQLAGGVAVLLQLDAACLPLGAACCALVGAYPLLKRVTHFPQVALGFAMNFGLILGTAAAAAVTVPLLDLLVAQSAVALAMWPSPALLAHNCAAAALAAVLATPMPVGLLYAGSVGWTVVYDTLYAHQDTADDARLGLRSTALWMGKAGTRPLLTGLALGTTTLWVAAGVSAGLGAPYFAAVGGAGLHMLWQVRGADLGNVADLSRRFVSNTRVGWLVLAGIIASRLLQVDESEQQGGKGAGRAVVVEVH